jgi:L-lactate dehydrogenase complex protein LldF
MNRPFRQHIRAALANPDLQVALDRNSAMRVSVMREAFDSLPDSKALRRRAHDIRAQTMADLDRYLQQFITNAQANGLIVHRASTAGEAVQIVLDIARQCDARLVAKSKTMISEEINLNPALEAAGLEVVETDLGEYIVQLRGEHPAHLITPAVHLRREDVGILFHEKLGIPLTDDVSAMTAAARKTLREVFLKAEIGISGVNFGVAETGSLCILTNEGNGRMVTTLPPVHIALMGIERLVPTLDDLGIMLTLLPRSATGQKMTVYSSLVHGPRRSGESEGPTQRHLVLLDNGRNAIRQSEFVEVLYCIRCGSCLNACPVFREIGGHAYVSAQGEPTPYAGPVGSVLSPVLFGESEFAQLARASSLCGACKEACPVDIDLPRLLLRVRAGHSGTERFWDSQPKATPARGASLSLRIGLSLFTWVAVSPFRYRLAQRFAATLGWLISPRSSWMRLPPRTGWGYSKDFPRPHIRPFRSVVHAYLRRRRKRRKSSETPFEFTPPVATNLAKSEPASLPDKENGSSKVLKIFTTELAALGGSVTNCPRSELLGNIIDILARKEIESVLAWDEAHLPPGLLEGLRLAGIRVAAPGDPSAQGGLTGTLAAIADTATLVIPGGPGRPLTASLLPEIHLAILDGRDIYENFHALLARWRQDGMGVLRAAPALVLVTGPSRTADIEMTLTIGVHGPREVHVICI